MKRRAGRSLCQKSNGLIHESKVHIQTANSRIAQAIHCRSPADLIIKANGPVSEALGRLSGQQSYLAAPAPRTPAPASTAAATPSNVLQVSTPTEAEKEEEEAAPVKVQTNFTLKLLKFDEGKKVALIKEIKGLLEGMNLVQAKKFVESAPTVIRADIPKEEAEKLSAALTTVGATCEIS